MYVVTVIFEPHTGQMEAFLPLMLENARRSLEDEPGCHRFDVCLTEDRGRVFLYEIYTDEAAFGVHVETAHFKSFDAAVADMVREKTVNMYRLAHPQEG
ncbi:antibiotic biosynthesis monooxygenase [Vannielia litorea]|uniref:putative quinol monooxygenase n=1 Tax=Vannielia litorea TaxID=1217970 RepID=UPI001C951D18|nr:putative quinol monooxygenase [Vannielia litorea]MBY6154662.1 antibiotic biosynthesis monooxygenase [Vannielia litorea]